MDFSKEAKGGFWMLPNTKELFWGEAHIQTLKTDFSNKHNIYLYLIYMCGGRKGNM